MCADDGKQPQEWAHETIRGLCATLKLTEPSMVPEAVRLLQSAAAAVPHMESFCDQVCKVNARPRAVAGSVCMWVAASRLVSRSELYA